MQASILVKCNISLSCVIVQAPELMSKKILKQTEIASQDIYLIDEYFPTKVRSLKIIKEIVVDNPNSYCEATSVESLKGYPR